MSWGRFNVVLIFFVQLPLSRAPPLDRRAVQLELIGPDRSLFSRCWCQKAQRQIIYQENESRNLQLLLRVSQSFKEEEVKITDLLLKRFVFEVS